MSDANASARRAGDDSARNDADLTDEQLWNAMEAEDAGRTAPEDEDDTGGDRARQSEPEGGTEGEDPPDDDAPGSSEDDRDGNRAGDGPDGMDPEALQQQIERLQHSLNSEKGRTAASRREIDRLNREIAAAREAQQANQNDDALKEREENERELATAREEYSEAVGPVVDRLKYLEGRLDKLSAREAQELEQLEARHAELLAEQEEAFFSEHPDGLQVVNRNRPAFEAWIEDQPKAIRDLYAANQRNIVDGKGAAYLVSLFKDELLHAQGTPAPDQNDRLQARRQRQLDGARSTRSGPRQRSSDVPPRDMDDPQAHWDHFDRLDRQQAR